MAVPEWMAPLSDSVLTCIEVILAGMIVLALTELTKPLLPRRVVAPIRLSSRDNRPR